MATPSKQPKGRKGEAMAGPEKLPAGGKVMVSMHGTSGAMRAPAEMASPSPVQTRELMDDLLKIAQGIHDADLADLPTDMARNKHHYLDGGKKVDR